MAAGNADQLVQRTVARYGHCQFDVPEMVDAFTDDIPRDAGAFVLPRDAESGAVGGAQCERQCWKLEPHAAPRVSSVAEALLRSMSTATRPRQAPCR